MIYLYVTHRKDNRREKINGYNTKEELQKAINRLNKKELFNYITVEYTPEGPITHIEQLDDYDWER